MVVAVAVGVGGWVAVALGGIWVGTAVAVGLLVMVADGSLTGTTTGRSVALISCLFVTL